MPDGSVRMVLTPDGMPQHWWDGSQWRDFDLTFRPTRAGETKGEFLCQDHGLRTCVLTESPMGEWVRVEYEALALQWAPLRIGREGATAPWGATATAVPVGSTLELHYAGSGGVRSDYTLLRNGLKHDVVLPRSAADLVGGGDLVLSWAVVIEGAAAVTGDGGIDLRGGGETSTVLVVSHNGPGLRITAPLIEDAAGRTFANRDSGARYRLTHQGGDLFVVELRVPMEWLLRQERAWPLRLDPSVIVNYGTLCGSPFNSLGAVDNTGWAGGVTDVNWDRTFVGIPGCTRLDNARTFAYARFPPASASPTIADAGGLIYACRAYCRFASVANDSAWDWVVSLRPPSQGYFDLCALQAGTNPINNTVWDRIRRSSLVIGGTSRMFDYVSRRFAEDLTVPEMSACGFPDYALEFAWRAQPNDGASGCSLLSRNTSDTFLEVHYTNGAGQRVGPATPSLTNRTDTSITIAWSQVQGASDYFIHASDRSDFRSYWHQAGPTTRKRRSPGSLLPRSTTSESSRGAPSTRAQPVQFDLGRRCRRRR